MACWNQISGHSDLFGIDYVTGGQSSRRYVAEFLGGFSSQIVNIFGLANFGFGAFFSTDGRVRGITAPPPPFPLNTIFYVAPTHDTEAFTDSGTWDGATDPYFGKVTIPSGFTSMTVTLRGGGPNGAFGNPSAEVGAEVVATYAVTPGDVYHFFVGTDNAAYAKLNGGGDNGGFGADGWGASDMRKNGLTLADRIMVAGGAGGPGFADGTGGHGGDPNGGNTAAVGAGQGATPAAGGAHGTGVAVTAGATDGTLGVGGHGAGAGAGGGGGYYGGGGGASDVGINGYSGGGGSSFVGTATSHTYGQRDSSSFIFPQIILHPDPGLPTMLRTNVADSGGGTDTLVGYIDKVFENLTWLPGVGLVAFEAGGGLYHLDETTAAYTLLIATVLPIGLEVLVTSDNVLWWHQSGVLHAYDGTTHHTLAGTYSELQTFNPAVTTQVVVWNGTRYDRYVLTGGAIVSAGTLGCEHLADFRQPLWTWAYNEADAWADRQASAPTTDQAIWQLEPPTGGWRAGLVANSSPGWIVT